MYAGVSRGPLTIDSTESRWRAVTRWMRPCGADQWGWRVDETMIAARLEQLRSEHGDLDTAIRALVEASASDQLQLARLKKRKLRLKDEITLLEDQLIPDIIA